MPAPPCGDYGDVNKDGSVDGADVMLIQRHILGLSLLTPEQFARADVNGDGKVDGGDQLLVERFIIGMIDTFPVCGAPPLPVTCSGATTHHPTGCALLLACDSDNDGVITGGDVLTAIANGKTTEEVDFLQQAIVVGSINALCPGCYTANGGIDPIMETPDVRNLEAGRYNITITKSGYDTVYATIEVSTTGQVSCIDVTGVAGCGTGYPRVEASGTSVKVYMAETTAVSDMCSWVTSIGGWRNLQWTSHVLEAYYVYIGAIGHNVGFSPVTWNDVLALYYYYIGDLSSAESKSGCGFT